MCRFFPFLQRVTDDKLTISGIHGQTNSERSFCVLARDGHRGLVYLSKRVKMKANLLVFRGVAVLAGSLLAAVSCTNSSSAERAEITAINQPPATTSEVETEDIEEIWRQVWLTAGSPEAEQAEQVESIKPFLSDEALTEVDGFFTVGLDLERFPTTYPKFEENNDGTVTINDCIVWSLPDEIGVSKWMEATAELNGEDGWVITEITRKADGCVPEVVGEKVIADYEASVEARTEYWNPANPEHPGIEATLTGPWKDTVKEQLVDLEAKGWYLIDAPESHPEVFEFLSPKLIRVLDCQTDENRGLFDTEGNEQNGIEERRPGQRSILEVSMELDGDTWKVSDLQAQRDWECEFAPTDEGLPWV